MNRFTQFSIVTFPFLGGLIVSLALASPSWGGTITQIDLVDFTDPKVLDFETATPGTISGTDSLFTDFGITQITITASSFLDGYNSRSNSSRALWANSGGLAIVDPGVAVSNANTIVYTLDFSSLQSRLGVGVHDHSSTYTYEFFNDATSVGSTTKGVATADLFQVYLENDMMFNRVIISNLGGGFAIDNITLEKTSGVIPVPGTLVFFGAGFAGFAVWRYRLENRESN